MLNLGIDVGGTFTDIVLQFPDSRLVRAKVMSTPGKEANGVMDAIRAVAEKAELPVGELLSQTLVINFGTTVATNAMLQNKGVKIGMITTKGMRDVVELRRGWKEAMFDIKFPPPTPLVPRRWRLCAAERIAADGSIVQPLDRDAVREHARRFREADINSIAICFLSSFTNPIHERQARDIVLAEHPNADIYLSSEVLPKIREYERFSTTLVNASLSPLLTKYLRLLTEELSSNGFRGELFVMQSNGGSVAPKIAERSGCATLLSGPAAGVVAAARIGSVCGADSVIGVDMGGTSYDVSLIRAGVPEMRQGEWFNRHFVGLPMLGIHTIGAGGGSIAWIDSGGALRVGPQSAGAAPGPACYGKGGTHATVTDAFICLGYLNPKYFLGGRMALDPERAREALRLCVADPMGMTINEAAVGILRIVNNNMANAIRYVSVARGVDPRDFALMSFGGAGSVTACTQARDLGIERLLVPRSASVLCALGELWADLRVSQILPRRGLASDVDTEKLASDLDDMASAYRKQFTSLPGVSETRTERFVDFRYVGQTHEIAVPVVNGGTGISQSAWNETIEAFHRQHQDLYAFQLKHRPMEMLSVSQDVVGVRPWSMQPKQTLDGGRGGALKGKREVCFEQDGRAEWITTPVYDGSRIAQGEELVGPGVIEETDTTILLRPGDRAVLNQFDVFDISVDQ